MNRRGQGTVLLLKKVSELVLGLLVAGILIYSAANIDSFSTFNKFYIEKDLSLLLDAMISSPGDITVIYPIKEGYKITVSDEDVNVIRESIEMTNKEVILNYENGKLTVT